MAELNSIQKFYKGKSIFVTGAGGFMGKVLIEKLLYSCSDVKEIMILLRPKKGKSQVQRVEEFKKNPMFKRIMDEKPDVMSKIIIVAGDLMTLNLGMNEADLKRVTENTEVMFHLAATLKLEETLKPAIQMNLTGTRHTLDVAKQMKKLLQMVHTSTAFCNPEQDILYEKIYDHTDKPADLIRCAEWMTQSTMASMQTNIVGGCTNTYIYTKRLAEILVRDEYENLPICLVRPGVVTPAVQEPIPGWVDSLNGPMGIMIAAGKGVLRSMLVDSNATAEVIPVDTAINAIIVIAKVNSNQTEKPSEMPVYNLTVHESKKLTFGQLFGTFKKFGREMPFTGSLWYPNGEPTLNVYVHTFKVFFFQLIPAYLIDFLFLCTGNKRFMVYVQKRIALGDKMLQYFTMRVWDFRSANFQALNQKLSPEEDLMFPIDTEKKHDINEYIYNCMLGGRTYCAHEPVSTIPRAKFIMKIQFFVDLACKILFFLFLTWSFCKITGLNKTLGNYF